MRLIKRFVISVIFLAVIIKGQDTRTSICRLAKDFEKALNWKKCSTSLGCTYLEKYTDCVPDNDTPKCLYYSSDQGCKYCLIKGKVVTVDPKQNEKHIPDFCTKLIAIGK